MDKPNSRIVTRVFDRALTHLDGAAEPAWLVEMTDESSGQTVAHAFPHAALTYRAAEYGIDLADVDTLLDVVLHEPHVELHHADPTFVYNTDRDTARRAHLARVAASPVRVSDPAGHLATIRQAHLATRDPARCAAMAAHADSLRARRRAETTPAPTAERISRG